jgi:hypothetical protein
VETLKIIIFLLCAIGIGAWAVWVSLRAEERKEAGKKGD